jgi:Spy/CpxP family protein refolding chaperone
MKRTLIWTLFGLLLVAGAIAAQAEFRSGHGWCGRGWHQRGPLNHVEHELNLNKSQIVKIRAIVSADRPVMIELFKELLAGAHQLVDATADGGADEGKVQAIAVQEGNTIAKLLQEQVAIKSRIYATVLNENQRRSADQMQQRWLGKLDTAVSRLQNHAD